MKRNLLALMLLATFSAMAAEPSLYVWQRRQTPELERAAAEFCRQSSGRLYFLAGELENDGRTLRFPSSENVDLARSVPVIRVHVAHLQKEPGVLAAEIAGMYAPWRQSRTLQIDLDAPESKLDHYRDLMAELRQRLPGVELSATVLPCHLKHVAAFCGFAAQCDFYVLQVHGLTRENGEWRIFDYPAALRAVMQAKALGRPFKTALPLYGSRVEEGELVKPDFSQVSRLAALCGEVIGFRLGLPGDGAALDLETALRVCRGESYSPTLETRWKNAGNGTWHLMIGNRGYLAEKVVLTLDFDVPPSDMDTFDQAVWDRNRRELTLILPPSGTESPYLWVRPGGDLKREPECQINRKEETPK